MSFISKLVHVDPADVTPDEREHADGYSGLLTVFGAKLKRLLGHSFDVMTHHYVTKESVLILEKSTPEEVIPRSVWSMSKTFTGGKNFKNDFVVAHLLCYFYDPVALLERGREFTLSLDHLTKLRYSEKSQFIQHIFTQLYKEDGVVKQVVCILAEGLTAYKIERSEQTRAMYINSDKDGDAMTDSDAPQQLQGVAQTVWSRKGGMPAQKRQCKDTRRENDLQAAVSKPSFFTQLTNGVREMYSGARAQPPSPAVGNNGNMADIDMGEEENVESSVSAYHDKYLVQHMAPPSAEEEDPQSYNPAAGFYSQQ
jgi:hypothetical protein